MAAPLVHLRLPSLASLKFRPAENPPALPPPTGEATFKSPLAISSTTYNDALRPAIPLTIAVIYIVSAFLGNAYNRKHGNKPWRISQNGVFKVFVILHNVALAIYSITTCVALVRSLSSSTVSPTGQNGIAGTVDSLCKMHGPRGFGDAITWEARRAKWQSKNSLIHLSSDGMTPDTTDLGRIWNEGLAFWGWLFYLSKFYEVVDTAIILAKGRRSSTLQIYHHAGAMISMWAGIRYMSPPIWMFVMVNSGIHGLMYTYYTLSALEIHVKKSLKQSLTVLQIAQFVVGVSYALAHLFVSYNIPVSVAYTVASTFIESPSDAISDVAQTTLDAAPWLKKLAFLALNAPGLAHNVRNDDGERFGPGANTVVSREETFYRIKHEEVSCLDTSGEVFAILLNVIYLLPLTLLFLRFFTRTYLRIPAPSFIANPSAHLRKLSDSATVAAEETTKTIESGGKRIEKDEQAVADQVVKTEQKDEDSSVKDSIQQAVESITNSSRMFMSKVETTGGSVAEEIAEATRTTINRISEKFETTGAEVGEGGGLEGVALETKAEDLEHTDSAEEQPSSHEEPAQTKQPSQTHVEETDLDDSDLGDDLVAGIPKKYESPEKELVGQVDDKVSEGTSRDDNRDRTPDNKSSPATVNREEASGLEGSSSTSFVKVEKEDGGDDPNEEHPSPANHLDEATEARSTEEKFSEETTPHAEQKNTGGDTEDISEENGALGESSERENGAAGHEQNQSGTDEQHKRDQIKTEEAEGQENQDPAISSHTDDLVDDKAEQGQTKDDGTNHTDPSSTGKQLNGVDTDAENNDHSGPDVLSKPDS